MRRERRFWSVITALFLVIAASRLLRLDGMTLNRDEVWSVWQTFGSPAQILQWTPYDWPPLYYLTLGAWRGLTSAYPVPLRMFSALVFPLGVAFLFRVMRRLRGFQAAVMTSLAYSALGFGILLSVEVRGYALLMALLPMALWLTVRYFDHPGWRRALWLALALAAMFYTSFTSAGAFMVLGLFTLLVYRWRVWRWWLPGALAGVLILPLVAAKAQLAVDRVEATQTLTPPPLPQALLRLFQDYTGYSFVLWVVLFVVATVLIVLFVRRHRVYPVAFFVWAVGMPLAMYVLNPVLGFFSPRYAWWIMPGIALWVGWGLAALPRSGTAAAVLMLTGMLFYPLPQVGQYQIWQNLSPLNENFAWLRDHMQWGDVILYDPGNRCGATEEWDYYRRTYFPNGLQFVDAPGDFRRVWVLNHSRQPETLQTILDTRYIPGRFVGPPGCVFRLYEAPPDIEGVLFENGMRFHGFDLMEGEQPVLNPVARHEAESVRLRLWWSAERQLDLDYSVSTYLKRESQIIDQVDGPPNAYFPPDAPAETSRWTPGQLYVEERELHLPYPSSGSYALFMAVYFWDDPLPVAAPGVNDDGHLRLWSVPVRSY